MKTKTIARYAFALAIMMLPVAIVHADNAGPQNTAPSASATSGAGIYANICQGCHMADARGATGAGTIPALAGDPRLEGSGYPIYVVLYGHGAMPALGSLLSDAQIAAVLNYVRQDFDNHFPGAITASEVHAARIPGKDYSGGY